MDPFTISNVIVRIPEDKKKEKILAPPSSLTMGVKKVAGQNCVRTVKIKKLKLPTHLAY